MSGKIYLHLLFFCGILCQGIFATLSDEDTGLSSNVLVRNRRVINRLPEGRTTPKIEDVNYLVRIKENNRVVCAGAILSIRTVITAIPCLRTLLSNYQIHSGVTGNTNANMHHIISRIDNIGSPPTRPTDGISLLNVEPIFIFSSRTGSINLYTGPVHENIMASVSGWGYYNPIEPITEVRHRLRSIIVPIMNPTMCQVAYRNRYDIKNGKHICTYHRQQCCANNDEGTPLVINNKLAGIYIWKGEHRAITNPDVFINLQHPDFSHWIRQHTAHI